MRVLLLTPPLVQANTPYPATPMLTAWLRRRGFDAVQEDASLALILRVFSPAGIRALLSEWERIPRRRRSAAVRHVLRHREQLPALVGLAVRFLQGRAPARTAAIAAGALFPEGPRFIHADVAATLLEPPERARHVASLFLDDVADAVRDGVDPQFHLARYADHLAVSAPRFDELHDALTRPPTLIGRWVDEEADRAWRRHRPGLLGLTVPFPGTLYGALRIARRFKQHDPRVQVVLGGGYVGTELRTTRDPRVFACVDALALDDGERTLEELARAARARRPPRAVHVLRLEAGRVVEIPAGPTAPVAHDRRPAPTYAGLPPAHYLPMAESPNPMHRLWSDRPWLKLQLAHGCYWHRCAFCDTALDYIRRFDPARPETVRRWIRSLIRETGRRDFHFVDEAAPPALLGRLSDLLIARGPRIEWWTNIRFDRAFTADLARRMAQAGCLAVTGGLETAHDRTLGRMQKGTTLADAARVMHQLAGAGLLVHAYLMYGFPGQTVQETVDALEYVRQLFEAGCVQSAYWHRFALTVHSPMYRNPATFGIAVAPEAPAPFARNEARYRDRRVRAVPDWVGTGLRAAVFNFMHGVGVDRDVRDWFTGRAPRTTVPGDFVLRAIG